MACWGIQEGGPIFDCFAILDIQQVELGSLKYKKIKIKRPDVFVQYQLQKALRIQHTLDLYDLCSINLNYQFFHRKNKRLSWAVSGKYIIFEILFFVHLWFFMFLKMDQIICLLDIPILYTEHETVDTIQQY